MRKTLILAGLLLGSTAQAKDNLPPPPSPVPQPDFAKVRQTGEETLKSTLFDPSSAQIVYTNGFQWGYAKPLIGRRTWGWIACGTLNAKNRMGGYVGASGFWIMSDGNGTISMGQQGQTMSTCDTGQRAELQSELKDAPALTLAGSGQTGVAEELEKLASLKDKGIITQAEFDAQKAKLLSR